MYWEPTTTLISCFNEPKLKSSSIATVLNHTDEYSGFHGKQNEKLFWNSVKCIQFVHELNFTGATMSVILDLPKLSRTIGLQ